MAIGHKALRGGHREARPRRAWQREEEGREPRVKGSVLGVLEARDARSGAAAVSISAGLVPPQS